MTRGVFLVLLAAVFCSVIGQFLLKAGALALGAVNAANLTQKIISMTTQPFIWGGLFIYGIGAIGFIVVLSRANISVVSPLLSMSYIFTVYGGKFIFGEQVTIRQWVGTGLIMMGVVLVMGNQTGGSK